VTAVASKSVLPQLVAVVVGLWFWFSDIKKPSAAKRCEQPDYQRARQHDNESAGRFGGIALELGQAFSDLYADGRELCRGILSRLVFPELLRLIVVGGDGRCAGRASADMRALTRYTPGRSEAGRPVGRNTRW